MTKEQERACALRSFVAGYLHGRGSLGNHDAAGQQAQIAFVAWWNETRRRQRPLDG